MKRGPECGREYDNTMMFCLDQGAALRYGPASREALRHSLDEPATAILPLGCGSHDEETKDESL